MSVFIPSRIACYFSHLLQTLRSGRFERGVRARWALEGCVKDRGIYRKCKERSEVFLIQRRYVGPGTAIQRPPQFVAFVTKGTGFAILLKAIIISPLIHNRSRHHAAGQISLRCSAFSASEMSWEPKGRRFCEACVIILDVSVAEAIPHAWEAFRALALWRLQSASVKENGSWEEPNPHPLCLVRMGTAASDNSLHKLFAGQGSDDQYLHLTEGLY